VTWQHRLQPLGNVGPSSPSRALPRDQRHPFTGEEQLPVQLIADTDIGVFAALPFTHREQYLGLHLEPAGEEPTTPDIAHPM